MKAGDHLFLVDGSSYIFRAYHALPPLTRKSDGLPVGAVAGFCNMLWKLLQEARDTEVGVVPTHFAVIFDHSAKTFRKELYPEYKANREEPPEDLRPQFGLIRQATRAFGLPCIETEGYEADDIIATYARKAREVGGDVTIISSDKDLMQLVGDKVILYDQMKDRRIGIPEVIEKWGVPPEQMIALQTLTGDSTDNIPGVPGIGPKTAAQLLDEYGDLEKLFANLDQIKQPKRRENLEAFADKADLTRTLVTLKDDVPLGDGLDDLVLDHTDGAQLVAFLKAMEFNTLTRRVAEATGVEAAEIEPSQVELGADMRGPDLDSSEETKARPDKTSAAKAETRNASAEAGAMTPAALAEARRAEAATAKFDRSAYECVRDEARLKAWVEMIVEAGLVAVDTETTSLDPMQAELCGVSLSTEPGIACYVPVGHKSGTGDLLGGGLVEDQISEAKALEILKPVLEDPSILKIGQNFKYDWLVFAQHGVEATAIDDTMLISYVLDAGRGGHGMDELADRWLGHACLSYKELTGSGKSAILFDQVPLDKATEYAAEDADVTLRLWRVLKPRLVAERLVPVYERLERGMVDVVARMESRGISVDRQILSRLSGELAQAAAAVEDEIYQLAGERFNIASPKQLGEILFGKMNLPGGRKTKTGQYSTSVQVLEDLAAEGHELPRKIVGWRQLTKLKSTYTDALPGYINPVTKRVHTSYALASTSTGRLSSSEPNLQNIPVRTEEGRKIRTAFVAEKGNKLLSADYSQIELRVLAHMAEIPQLVQAFEDGLDIHAMTASEMFGVPVEGMDPMVRRRAKAINFGIIYGISAFGLANQLSIPRSEAKDYIDRYFERFPGIRDYMEATKRACRDKGYVETVFGRRAHYPEIASSNPQMRAFNERAAINAPIQGSAADIIRRAMMRMDAALAEAKLTARMLLQVHDELIFEVAADEVEKTMPVIVKVMEEATLPAIRLRVPLKVDARAADNWDEAH
ncbi:MAG: DNA polymerase I [Salaquimonas sp.]|nr:DNA polymerase I [Salaquimonas sp.]